MRVYDLKANYQENPIGISLDNLVLTWKISETKGNLQTDYHVIIAEDEGFSEIIEDSGVILSQDNMYLPKKQLSGGKQYYWKVTVSDDIGNTAQSDIAGFEGGHPKEDWKGCWIQPPFTEEIYPVFHKELELKDINTITRSRLYICGLGLYEVYINGQKAGEQFLTPYFTDYRYRIQYQTYSISEYLVEGLNKIDVYLGAGWYKGKFGYLNEGQLCNYYGNTFKLIADIYLYYEDKKTVIGTDESWLALKSPVLESGIYYGETYDARLEKNLKDIPVRQMLYAKPSEKPSGKLIPMNGLQVRAMEKLQVKELITTRLGETVLDFGQEITGWVEFVACGEVGKTITLQYGEVLQDGVFYRDNLRTAEAQFTYIADGRKEKIRPHFTFYGFRYVKVSGMKVDESNLADFTATALYSDLKETGKIVTSNNKINRLIENTKWSQKDNFLDIPTDCPQRDERLGWTGDAQIFSGAASYHMLTVQFFRKYMEDMLLEQREKQGAVPYVVPDVLTVARIKNGEPEFDYSEDLWGEAGSSVWGDAASIIPWNMYVFFGNKKVLEEQYSNMKEWADFIINMDNTYCGGKRLWDCGFHFGDWLSLDPERADNKGNTDETYIASLYYMKTLQIVKKSAAILGYDDDVKYYGNLETEVKKAVASKYKVGGGRLTLTTQTSYILGIYFELFEPEEMEAASEMLVSLLKENNGKLATGFVGTGYLCNALSVTAHDREAYDLLLNEEYPGWLYEVNLGATTIWERWNSLTPEGKISSTGMNSLNHYAYGAIAEWIYRFACGLCPVEEHPGFRRIIYAPHTDERFQFMKAEYESISGTYKSEWHYEKDRIVYELEIPFNCEAELQIKGSANGAIINGEKVDNAWGTILKTGTYKIEC